jgi:hypothetical protein
MSRQFFWFAGSVLLIAIVFVGVFLTLRKNHLPESDVYKTIPQDAALLVETSNVYNFLTETRRENPIWRELQGLDAVQELDEVMGNLVPVLETIPNLVDAFDRTVVFSGHKTGKSQLSFLTYIKIRQRQDLQDLEKTLSKDIPQIKEISSRKYSGEELSKVTFRDSLQLKPLFYAVVKDVLVFGRSSMLVENAIRQSDLDQNLRMNADFEEVYQTAGKNVFANIYLNLKTFPDVASFMFSKPFQNFIQEQTLMANWVELDMNVKEDALLFNGFTSENDSAENYLRLFLEQNPVESEIVGVLPATTSIFFSLGMSDFASFQDSYYQFLVASKNADKRVNYFTELNKTYQVDFEQLFTSMVYKEVAYGFADLDNNTPVDEPFIVLRVQSRATAKEKLKEVLKTMKGAPSYSSPAIRIDSETKFEVLKLPVGDLFGHLLGGMFGKGSFRYAAFFDNYMFVAQSRGELYKLLHYNVLGKTLDKDKRFHQFADYLSTKSNIFIYGNLFRAPDVLGQFLKEDLAAELVANAQTFRKFQGVALQIRKSNDLLFNNLFLKYTPNAKEEARTLWESHLDTVINFKPQLVENHYTKEHEIFVQDLNNNIYLINKVGRVLWKLKLDEPIIGQVQQVDYYKNGKLQLLFSTPSKLHLIDRNGNYVERYPVKLRARATAGLALFDYDKSREYRIFIPCANKRVYLYNIDGTINDGWEFSGTDTQVLSPVQHFRIGTRDYIILHDKYRVYILNRRGQVRVPVQEQFAVSANNNFYLYKDNSKAGFVTTDTSGVVKIIDEKGNVMAKDFGKFSPTHFFLYEDLDADNNRDYIFVDEEELEIFKDPESKLFDYSFDHAVTEAPSYYYFSYNDRKLGIADRQAGKIYLFNSEGEQYEGFPLQGSTPFTIGFLGNDHKYFNLLVGTKENFLYNYTVH